VLRSSKDHGAQPCGLRRHVERVQHMSGTNSIHKTCVPCARGARKQVLLKMGCQLPKNVQCPAALGAPVTCRQQLSAGLPSWVQVVAVAVLPALNLLLNPCWVAALVCLAAAAAAAAPLPLPHPGLAPQPPAHLPAGMSRPPAAVLAAGAAV
jgi:hypothetical protein